MLVLTCAHLVKGNQSISVYVVDPDTRHYRRLSARVSKRTHPHKEDLALLTVENSPAVRTPLHVGLADDFAEGEERKVAIMSVSIGAKERPSSWEGRIFQYTMSVSSFMPDESDGATWKLPKGTLHGGIVEANSGSPVFQGERLVGLAESSPGIGIKGSEILTGVQTSLPQTIRSFLVEATSKSSEITPSK